MTSVSRDTAANKLKQHSRFKESARKTCISSVKGLVEWSKPRVDSLHNISLSGYGEQDSAIVIKFDKVESYLNELRSSGFLSQHFLDTQMSIYRKVSKRLAREKLKDGIIPELSYDITFLTQELDYDLSRADSFLYRESNGNVYLKQDERTLVYKMDNQCKIDSIYVE